MLVQGTGTGWDVISWARLRPRRIIATDMFPFEESWQEIARYCLDRYRVPVEFRTAPLEDHGFLDSDSVDLIVSDAVYEHCRDLPQVMRESRRLLRPGGYLYASYGPLYFCAGGTIFPVGGAWSTLIQPSTAGSELHTSATWRRTTRKWKIFRMGCATWNWTCFPA